MAFQLSLKALSNIRDNGRLHKALNIIAHNYDGRPFAAESRDQIYIMGYH